MQSRNRGGGAAIEGFRRALVLTWWALVSLLGSSATGGCKGCGSNAVVAELVQRDGTVDEEHAAHLGAWSAANPGATFALGDAVRTNAGASAKVEFRSGGGLQLHELTTVRFLAGGGGPTARGVGVETGEAEIESGGAGLTIQTSVGLAQLEPGSHVHIASAPRSVRFEVLVGRAQFEQDAVGPTTIEPGQRFAVRLGAATLEAVNPESKDAGRADAEAARGDAGIDSGVSDAGATAGEVLAEVHGAGVQSAASGSGPMSKLSAGSAKFAEGTRLVVPEGATVDLTRSGEHVTLIGRTTASIGKAGEAIVSVQSGKALIGASTPGLRIDVPGGSIVLSSSGPGTVQGEIDVEGRAAHVASNQGQLVLRGKTGSLTVGPGETGTLGSTGAATIDESLPGVADVAIPAGESPVIHAPHGVPAVAIRIDACSGEGIVQVAVGAGARRVFARGSPATAIVALGLGAHKYEARCVGGGGAPITGVIHVLHDAGAAKIPRVAPFNLIDADGRHYSVLYQNLLPQMTFRWPSGGTHGPAMLHLEKASGVVQKFPATSGSVALPAGAVHEGTYTFWFQADSDPQNRSLETTLRIGFDNAAPAAEIQQPVDGQPSSNPVHVTGVAAEGSTVSVGVTAIPLDPQSRFDGDVPGPPEGGRAIAIRIAQSAHGIHYYLRMFGSP